MLTGRLDEAREQAREAARLAAEAGDEGDEVQAAVTLGVVEALRGDPHEGLARLRACLVRARDLDDFEAVLRCYGNLTYVLLMHGHYRQAFEMAVEGEAVCRQYGPLLAVAGTLVNNGVWALVALGRWEQARDKGRAVLAEWMPRGVGLLLHLTLAELAVGRGDAPRIDEHLAPVRIAATDDPYFVGAAAAVGVERLLWDDSPEQAREAATQGLRALDGQQDAHLSLMLRALHLRALGDLAERSPGAAGLEREVAEALAAARAAAGDRDLLPLRALLQQCEAEAARARRADALALWRATAQAWQTLERPYAEAYALWRLATALLAGHARTAAVEPLARALRTSEELHAAPLAARLHALALAGGVERDLAPAPVVPAPAAAAVRLTAREQQVLALLAAGRTNRQIASALFIAEKTVSVHVSNLLGKLGATNRVEAAGTARRLGLVSDG